ncbi:hypothetical protein Q4E93_13305 [Flavitalea sp. BT771]|uniref:hypothetical protein n=1 Tax=Flavitalea sp. BT771 TaxID=3063329 RepID=UPI0026E2F64E|nr:hypothetical protein [Flavitalea sp. BT771]MDO6431576.1 hypothetical protein [Flavitalea sp. BT771]MDV6220484.1 hypothetical protein [Flavitalea sp. BT771]
MKDPTYSASHLANIVRLTQQLCIVQYWGESDVRWHYRDPSEFLESTLEELRLTPTNFRTLLYVDGIPEAKSIWDAQCVEFEKVALPENFSQIFEVNPIFEVMFPRTKTAMNMLSMLEDILAFSATISADFVLYKQFRRYLTTAQQQLPGMVEMAKAYDKSGTIPQRLTWDDLWEQAAVKKRLSSNAAYDQIIDLFTTTDMKGYRRDERFANLIDDAIHCFYAAHAAYFITLDKRCADKAKVVYKQLGIVTKVLTPAELVSLL